MLHRPWLWREFPPFFGHFLFASLSAQSQLSKGVCRRGSCCAAGERQGRAPGESCPQAAHARAAPVPCSSGTAQHRLLRWEPAQCSAVQGSHSSPAQLGGCSETRAITRLLLTIQLVLTSWHYCRTDVLPLKACHQCKLLRGKKRKIKICISWIM